VNKILSNYTAEGMVDVITTILAVVCLTVMLITTFLDALPRLEKIIVKKVKATVPTNTLLDIFKTVKETVIQFSGCIVTYSSYTYIMRPLEVEAENGSTKPFFNEHRIFDNGYLTDNYRLKHLI
jgi:hypothetical protein